MLKRTGMHVMPWVLLIAAAPASAEVLGSWTYGGGHGSADQWPHRIRIWISFAYTPDGLFGDVWLDTTHVDTTLTATPTTDPRFVGVVARLTNGIWEWICMGETIPTGYGGGWCRPEYEAFNLGVVDFYGATIDSISLTVDGLRFDDTGGTSVWYTATVTVFGSWGVPVRGVTWGRVKMLYR
jgi:hypothetical protein